MRITFLGGAQTVTGSKFLVETKTTKVLIDCGLFQGYKWLRERNWEAPPLDIASLDAVILTHAHLDHSGYLPVLYKRGYRGPVYTHHSTKELCQILLEDSGHIQEDDAKYYKKHKISKHENPQALYDRATAHASIKLFKSVDFHQQVTVGDITFYLQTAGHILGAASIILEGEGKRVGFSGDVGRPDDILMRGPEPLPELDHLLLESTYGNRLHDEKDSYEQLKNIVNETAKNSGVLLIPAFAVGRAQLIQHMLVTLMNDNLIPRMRIYLDSPMAISVSDIYCRYSAEHKLTEAQCTAMSDSVIYTKSVEDSKEIAEQNYPHIIIAGSGMATGGRILHHFKRLIGRSNTTVLFTGYQAGGTRGAKMLAGVDTIKLHGDWIPVRAKIVEMGTLSGHGDYKDIGAWLKSSALRSDTKIHLIHGDLDALEGMRDYIRRETSFPVDIAGYRHIIDL